MNLIILGYKITPYRDLKRPAGLKRSSSLRTPRGRRDSGSNDTGMLWYFVSSGTL